MVAKGFSEDDINKYIEFLNYVATHAKFDNRTVKDQLDFVKLLQYQQTVILKQMQDMVVGQPKLHTPTEQPETKKKTRSRKGAAS